MRHIVLYVKNVKRAGLHPISAFQRLACMSSTPHFTTQNFDSLDRTRSETPALQGRAPFLRVSRAQHLQYCTYAQMRQPRRLILPPIRLFLLLPSRLVLPWFDRASSVALALASRVACRARDDARLRRLGCVTVCATRGGGGERDQGVVDDILYNSRSAQSWALLFLPRVYSLCLRAEKLSVVRYACRRLLQASRYRRLLYLFTRREGNHALLQIRRDPRHGRHALLARQRLPRRRFGRDARQVGFFFKQQQQ